MAIIEGGTSAELTGVGAEAAKPMHTTAKPLPYGSNGHFSYGGFTGILPAALSANSEIFQFRWTHATLLAAIHRIRISASVSTTFFAAGVPVQIDLVKASSWSAAGTGGTSVTPAATLKRRSAMSSTQVATGDIRIATTAALGAGTKTLEANSIATMAAGGPITASLAPQIIAPGTVLFEAEVGDAGHHLVLAQNEGVVIRSVAVPATGTWTAAITIDWAEVGAY